MKAEFPYGWRSPATMLLVVSLLALGTALLVMAVGVAADVSPEAVPAQVPLLFIENVGQYDPQVRFLLRDAGMTWLAEDALWVSVLDLQGLRMAEAQRLAEQSPDAPIPGVHLKFSFEGANPRPILEPFGEMPTRVSYLAGQDPSSWRAGVPVWAGVRYRDLYPGIDLVLSADGSPAANGPVPWRLEVGPGADLTAVQLRVEGARWLDVEGGEIVLGTDVGPVSVPLLAVHGVGRGVSQSGLASGGMPGVSELGVETFVLSWPLAVVEESQNALAPGATSSLGYGSYLGGSDLDYAEGVDIDGEGAIYVVGRTQSADFPTVPGSYTTTLHSQDAFVSKFDPAGNGPSDLVYSTFIGGQAFDAGYDIAVSGGKAYIAGYTASGSFPTTPGAFDRTCGNAGDCDGQSDGFFAKLNEGGTALDYSTYVGGGNQESATGIAFADGTAYLAGTTRSKDFRTTDGAYDRSCGTDGNCNPSAGVPLQDVFFVRLAPAGQGQNDLLYGTFLGGSNRDYGNDIAVSGGNAYVTGRTSSYDFPGTGYRAGSDAFVVRFDPSGSGSIDLVYSRILGGAQWDEGLGIDVSGSEAFVTGETGSVDFPVTTGGYLGSTDAFFVQLDGSGGIGYGAYLGGTGLDRGYDLAVDRTGAAVVVGFTQSGDLPTTEEAHSRILNGSSDAFLARLSLSSSKPQHITYASYLGGSGGDLAYGVAVDEKGHAFLTGATDSTDFPTTAGAFATVLGGTYDAYVSVITVTVPPALDVEKSTNGLDADEPPGPYLLVGSPIIWTYTVTNTGGFSLTNVIVTDDHLGTVCQIPSLDPETSVTCTKSGVAGRGQYANLASVTGQPPLGLDAPTDTDLSHYFGAEPGVDLEKRTNGADADIPPGTLVRSGYTVTWTYQVTNTGNVALSGISVMDEQEGTASCPYATLAPRKAMSCILTSTAVVGEYGNSASVTGTPPGGLPVQTDSDVSHYFGIEPIVSLLKSTSGEDALPAPGLQIREGTPVTWTYLVSNTGNITLTNIHLGDDQIGTVICPADTLAAKAAMTCTVTGTAVEGQYTNTGVVSATPPVGSDVEASDLSHYYGIRPALAIEKLTNGEEADAEPGPLVEVGDAVTWTYLVTNTGNVTLTNVTVSDDVLGPVSSCPSTTLEISQAMTCESTGWAEAGQYANIGRVEGTPPVGDGVSAADVSHYYGVAPGIDLEKHTNGEDGDLPPGAYVLAGETVTWTYLVTNRGNIALMGVSVTDDRVTLPGECAWTTLDLEQTVSCEATGVAEEGPYTNTATASGTPPIGLDVMDQDMSHYFGATPGIDVEKATNGLDADEAPGPYLLAGEEITWTYWVSNTGNVRLTGVTISDDVLGPVATCPSSTLEIGQEMTCTVTGAAGSGQYTNLAVVSGTPPGGLAAVTDSDASHYFGAEPAIGLEKRTNGQPADTAPGPTLITGDPVVWTYDVANLGNVTLTVVVTDSDPLVDVSCAQMELGAGESTTCTADGVAENLQYSNVGAATGTPPGGLAAVSATDPSHYLGIAPAIDVEKRTNGYDADQAPGPYVEVGDTVIWTYWVRNTGDYDLSNVKVVDNVLGQICTFPALGEGSSQTCTRVGSAGKGPYANRATATANPLGLGVIVSDTDSSHYFGAELVLAVQKHTMALDADDPPGPVVPAGSVVTWTYQVTNSSNVTLSQVVVSDDVLGVIGCETDVLVPDQAMTCQETGIAAADQQTNLGTVTARPPGDLAAVSTSDRSHYYGAEPALRLVKRTNGYDADEPIGPYLWYGTPVTWTYLVENTGNVTVTDVSVMDNVLGPVACDETSLAAGEAVECTMLGTAELGQYANTGTVSGVVAVWTGTGTADVEVGDSDPSHYFGISPAIEINKATNGHDADEGTGPKIFAGAAVTWTYVVTNSGDITLTEVTVVDDVQGVVCDGLTLAPEFTATCEFVGVAEVGQYANVGTVTGNPPAGPPVSDSDPSHYLGRSFTPAIAVEKHTNGADADTPDAAPLIPVGDLVEWEYTVTNLGNAPVISILVTDSDLGAIECPSETLEVDTTMACTVTGTAVADLYSNLATVTGTAIPEGLDPVVIADTDPSHYFGSAPQIHLEKLTNGEDADQAPGPYILVGDPVTWTYEVSNLGNVGLSGIKVQDDRLGEIPCSGTLPVGGSTTCTAAGIVTEGPYTNTGTVTGTPAVGLPVSDSDESHHMGVALSLTLEVRTNGWDADLPPGPLVPVGEPVTWTYVLTNGGNVPLDVAVGDSEGVEVTCDDTRLVPRAGTVCRAYGTAEYGQYANTGTVIGTPPGGLAPIVVQDASHYLGTRAGIAVEKRTNGVHAGAMPGLYLLVGEPVTWTYRIMNTGNVTLTDVALVDSRLGTVPCPFDNTLAVNESVKCEAYGNAEAGQYSNVATVRAKPLVGGEVEASDAGYYYGTSLAIGLAKHTNGQEAVTPPGPYLEVGWPVTWTYLVDNSSNVPLEIEVSDDLEGAARCPQPVLAAGQSMTCTLAGTVALGQYENVAVVEGRPPGGLASVTETAVSHHFGFVSEPAIVVEKWTNGKDADTAPGPFLNVGDAVRWEYRVANAGNVALGEVEVVDDRLGAIDCVSDTLDVGQSMVCTVQGTAEAGQYTNLATVRGTYLGTTVEDSDPSHYFGMVPGLTIEKGTNGHAADTPPGPYLVEGSTVQWTYEVRNSGNVALTQVSVSDDREGPASCPKTVLAPSEVMICTTSGTVANGGYQNLGTVTGKLPTGKTVTANDPSHYFGIFPDVSIRKLTYDPGLQEYVDAPEPPGPVLLEGQVVTWTYVITNSGDISLTEVSLIDDPQGGVACPKTSLAPLEAMTCTLSEVVEAGQYANVGEVSGVHPASGTVRASDASHYLGLAVTPAIDVRKTVNGVDVHQPPGPFIPIGEAVQWDYLVTNVGSNAPVEGIVLSDDQVGPIECPETRLDEGMSMSCSAEGVAVAGPYSNTATVTGMGVTFRGTVPVTDTDVSYYFGTAPAIDLIKLTNGVAASEPPGPSLTLDDPVTWTYVARNTGNVSLDGIAVVDDNGTAGDPSDDEEVCRYTSLEPGKAKVCVWTGIVVEGQYTNVATVTASYEGVAVVDRAVGYYVGEWKRVYLPLVFRQGP